MKKIIFAIVVFLIVHCIRLGGMIEDCMSQWQPDVRLTNNDSASYTSSWCVAANGNVVHVVWFDFRDDIKGEIYYKRSTNEGVSWGADIRLTNNTASSGSPTVAVSGSVVHVVWHDNRDGNYEIYNKRSTDAGVSWGTDTRLTNYTADSRVPSVSVSGPAVCVVWEDHRDGNWEIYYKRSTDAGISWGADIRLTNNTAESGSSSVTVSGLFVHVVWNDTRDGNYEIYYKRSTDEGLSWGTDTRLTNNTAWSFFPSVAVSGSDVQVVWNDNRDGIYNYEIYYKRSTDGGVSWGADTRLTNDIASSSLPSVAVSGSVVHVVWSDIRDGNYEIYYKRSTDAGLSWGIDTRLSFNTARSESPSVAVSGSVVHVVWRDERDGYNGEIYYKRNPTGNTIGIKNITSEIPSSYSLQQNYPNPFNPMTNVKFQIANTPLNPLSRGEMISLKVFDITGKEVATLVNESALGGHPGTYEVQWDGTNYPSGIYFYRLSAGDFSETKKMLLLK